MMRRILASITAVLALVLGALGFAAAPASAFLCTGVWPQTPYGASVWGNNVVIGEVRCSGGGQTRDVQATCVEELVFPWGWNAGGVWIIPDYSCTAGASDAALSDCNHYFRTSTYGANWQYINSSGMYWDGCL